LARLAPDAPKEVTAMSTINNRTTAQNPSRLGMPISGYAFGTAGVCATAAFATGERLVAGLVKGDFPGTSAWRPPNC
jgi:hypothetical protein